ncbi:hypothetical protein D3C71_1889480 [compost metagenome]
MHLLHFGVFFNSKQCWGLAPAGGVDMNEGKQRLADGLGIDERRHATNCARAPQALYALVRGRR